MGFGDRFSGMFSSQNTFADLNDLKSSGKSEIVLEDDFNFTKKDKDFINGLAFDFDNFTLDGNNHEIDAKGANVAFNISAKNITFKNILFKNSNLLLKINANADCKFVDCHFEENSKVVEVEEEGNCSFIKCNFKSNEKLITNYGKACLSNVHLSNNKGHIQNRGELIIEDCEFLNNTSLINEGLLENGGILRIINTDFVSNISVNLLKNFSKDSLKISDSRFRNNISQVSLCNNETICIISNSHFENNASNKEFSADMMNLEDAKLNLKEVTIVNNSKSILNEGHISTTFDDNEIESRIYNADSASISKIMGSTFDDLNNLIQNNPSAEIVLSNDFSLDGNEADLFKEGIKISRENLVLDGNHHIIDAIGKAEFFTVDGENISFKNMIFKNGFSQEDSAAIKINKPCSFINCQFDNASGNLINAMESSSFINCTFENSHGNVINNYNCEMEIIESQFIENEGISVNNNEGKIRIIKSPFKGNKSAIVKNKNGIIEMEDSQVSENYDVFDTDGGRIEISRINFNQNHQQLINNIGTDIELHNCEFKDNGDIIRNQEGRIQINETDFYFNVFTILNEDDGELSIDKSSIGENGLSIKNISGEINLNHCIFTDNKSNDDDSIIFNDGGRMKILECDFLENKSISLENINDESIIVNQSDLLVSNSNFRNNAYNEIIKNNNLEKSSLSILNGEFIENDIGSSVIVNDGKSLTLSKVIFEDNKVGDSYLNIINNSEMIFLNPVFKNKVKSIINYGTINTKKEPRSKYVDYIDNHGTIVDEVPPDEKMADFSSLDELIHNDDNNKDIHLEKSFAFGNYEVDYYEGGIELDIDDLTIDGHGYTINGNDKSRIFLISGNNITLKNINFKFGCSYKTFFKQIEGGGLVKINSNSSVKFENCDFDFGFSQEEGGAIYNKIYSSCTISKCKFNSNRSSEKGGAIVNEGKMDLLESIFLENSSKDIGGAISNYGEIDLSNIAFESNGEFIDDEIDFRNLSGVIYNQNLLNLENTNFEENKGSVLVNDESGLIKLDSVKINNNLVENGAIIINNAELNASDLNLDNNKGSIMENDKSGKVMFNICSLHDNSVETGEMIKNRGEIEINESSFKDNIVKRDPMISNLGKISMDSLQISNNQMEKEGFIKNSKVLNLYKATLESNRGILIQNFGEISFEDSLLKANLPFEEEYNEGLINNSGRIKLHNSKIIENISLKAIINNLSNGKIEVSDSLFENNGDESSGALMRNDSGKITINHSRMNDNIGGCIDNYGELSLDHSDFNNNRKGVIFNKEELMVYNSVFENNESGSGAAIHSRRGRAKIVNSKFKNNHADNGGAIYNTDGGPIHSGLGLMSCSEGIILIENSYFENNSAISNGGAVFNNEDGVLIVKKCDFQINTAQNGGAIYSIHADFNPYKNRLEISDCSYFNNSPNNLYTDARY